MQRLYQSLFGQVVIALVIGIMVGIFDPKFGESLKPLGDGFIKLVTMIIPMIVFCVVVQGISGAGELKKVGRVGLKALIYFEAVTAIALVYCSRINDGFAVLHTRCAHLAGSTFAASGWSS